MWKKITVVGVIGLAIGLGIYQANKESAPTTNDIAAGSTVEKGEDASSVQQQASEKPAASTNLPNQAEMVSIQNSTVKDYLELEKKYKNMPADGQKKFIEGKNSVVWEGQILDIVGNLCYIKVPGDNKEISFMALFPVNKDMMTKFDQYKKGQNIKVKGEIWAKDGLNEPWHMNVQEIIKG